MRKVILILSIFGFSFASELDDFKAEFKQCYARYGDLYKSVLIAASVGPRYKTCGRNPYDCYPDLYYSVMTTCPGLSKWVNTRNDLADALAIDGLLSDLVVEFDKDNK